MERVETAFGHIQIGRHYLIVNTNEGHNVVREDFIELLTTAYEHFGEQPWALIANRNTDYSVDPMVLKEMAEIGALYCLAIVSPKLKANPAQQIETAFVPFIPIKYFDELAAAITWTSQVIPQPSSGSN
jgi:hypothetical protein